MATTIKEIATQAGVSQATVSLVLNDRPGVGQETRDKILAIAARLGYEQKKLKAQDGSPAGVVRFLRIVKHGHIINPNHRVFIADYIDGIEREAKKHDYRLEIHTHEGFDPGLILKSLNAVSFEGVIVLGTELDEKDMEVFRSVPIPLVIIDTFDPYLSFDFVDMDNESAVFSAVEYFYTHGHRRIGLVKGSIETRNFKHREHAFMDSLERFDLKFNPKDLFVIDSTFEKGREDMARQLKGDRDLPTALFCVNDIVAYGCIQALKESGLSIPGNVSVIGFDDLPSNEFMEPRLTSVKVSKRNIGRRALQLLLDRMVNVNRPYEKILVGGELVVRNSVRKLEENGAR